MSSKQIKRIILMFVLLVILSTSVTSINIDGRVIESFKNDSGSKVKTIILLKDESDVKLPLNNSIEERSRFLKEKSIYYERLQEKFLSSLVLTNSKIVNRFIYTNGFYILLSKEDFDKISKNVMVESIDSVKEYYNSNDKSFELVNANNVWQREVDGINLKGNGESICLIDTGIDENHTEFVGKIEDEQCYCSPEGGCCPNGQAIDPNSAMDYHGHGTGMAGLIVSNTFGIAPESKLFVVKAKNKTVPYQSNDLVLAIDWCKSKVTEGKDVSVISMSLGARVRKNPAG